MHIAHGDSKLPDDLHGRYRAGSASSCAPHGYRGGTGNERSYPIAFAQLIEYRDSKPEEVRQVHEKWEQSTQGKRSPRRAPLTQHQSEPDRYCELVFFDSLEAARANSGLPATDQYAKGLSRLTQGDITYFDLDIVEDKKL